LCFWPAELKLEGDGRLKPTARQSVWAEANGYVDKVHVKHNDLVTKGKLLVEQRSYDLEKEVVQKQGERDAAIQKLLSNQYKQQSDNELTEVDIDQVESENRQLEKQIDALNETLGLLKKQQEMLQVRSPIDGRVVTFDVEKLLLNRPVNRGEELLEIADPTSDWELEVLMPEYRMGHVAKAAQASADGALPVTFYLALNPKKQLKGQVVEVHRSAEVRGEEGNTVLIRVSFDQQALRDVITDPKIGATATAKIHCGQRAIGYVWFHDLIDFVRAKIMFRLF
jgi:multidrug efflux pump subunit AcrA (membrane-fusion protein)